MTIELRAPGARALLEPAFGGRLHQLCVEVDGVEQPLLVAPGDPAAYAQDPVFGGCYPMAPWPNRIRHGAFEFRGSRVIVANGREHALHGLVLDQPWEVVARVGRIVEMTCSFGAGWPWEGKAWQRFELGPNFLAMKLEVRSAGDTFPAGCGWHPWFRRHVAGAADVRLTVPATQRYELVDHLPTGTTFPVENSYALDGSMAGDRRLDDCYTRVKRSEATLDWGALQLTMSFAAQSPHMQVYLTPEAVCLEPQTCAPDAFNLQHAGVPGEGTAIVSPGRPLAFASRWTWDTRPVATRTFDHVGTSERRSDLLE